MPSICLKPFMVIVMEKTNVMRLLDAAKIEYQTHEYNEEITDGKEVARLIGEDENSVFKTLVTEAAGRKYYVFVIPVSGTLDLKKAAVAAGEKALSMLKQKDLFALTGYVHGGCSPVGMKKLFPTFIDEGALSLELFYVSAGKVGHQLHLSPVDLAEVINAQFKDLLQ